MATGAEGLAPAGMAAATALRGDTGTASGEPWEAAPVGPAKAHGMRARCTGRGRGQSCGPRGESRSSGHLHTGSRAQDFLKAECYASGTSTSRLPTWFAAV